MMKTDFIAHILDSYLGDGFIMVCPVNMLDLDKNGIYVVNTDCGKGRHWVVLYVQDETVEFFDSFGRHPKDVQNGDLFMQCIGDKTLVVTSKNVQHPKSYVCGWYCLAYAMCRVKFSLHKLFQLFNDNRCRNDDIVVYIVKKLFVKKHCK